MKKLSFALALAAVSNGAFALQTNSTVFMPHSIPAVSQPGLIALAFIVGLIGARLIRKHRDARN